MVSKEERRIVHALGDMIQEVGPVQIQTADGMTHRFYLDKVTKEVRHRQFREVQVEDENQTAAAMSVLNSLHNEGKLV